MTFSAIRRLALLTALGLSLAGCGSPSNVQRSSATPNAASPDVLIVRAQLYKDTADHPQVQSAAGLGGEIYGERWDEGQAFELGEGIMLAPILMAADAIASQAYASAVGTSRSQEEVRRAGIAIRAAFDPMPARRSFEKMVAENLSLPGRLSQQSCVAASDERRRCGAGGERAGIHATLAFAIARSGGPDSVELVVRTVVASYPGDLTSAPCQVWTSRRTLGNYFDLAQNAAEGIQLAIDETIVVMAKVVADGFASGRSPSGTFGNVKVASGRCSAQQRTFNAEFAREHARLPI